MRTGCMEYSGGGEPALGDKVELVKSPPKRGRAKPFAGVVRGVQFDVATGGRLVTVEGARQVRSGLANEFRLVSRDGAATLERRAAAYQAKLRREARSRAAYVAEQEADTAAAAAFDVVRSAEHPRGIRVPRPGDLVGSTIVKYVRVKRDGGFVVDDGHGHGFSDGAVECCSGPLTDEQAELGGYAKGAHVYRLQ